MGTVEGVYPSHIITLLNLLIKSQQVSANLSACSAHTYRQSFSNISISFHQTHYSLQKYFTLREAIFCWLPWDFKLFHFGPRHHWPCVKRPEFKAALQCHTLWIKQCLLRTYGILYNSYIFRYYNFAYRKRDCLHVDCMILCNSFEFISHNSELFSLHILM